MDLQQDQQRGCEPANDPRPLFDSNARLGPVGSASADRVSGEVVIHFPDDPPRVYQLRQWLPVFERLDTRHRAVVVMRHPETYAAVSELTSLRCVLAPSFRDLMRFYEAEEHKVAIYVNNSVLNFDSLVARRMLHIHVNHGESDKLCMVSNQVKAYDRVFVAGEAAVRRHRAMLLGFDDSKLVRIGQPQLDLRPAPILPPTTRRTILYAPTWEGEDSSNRYTSVDVYGTAIVAAALAVPDVRVVYKPHPRVTMSRDVAVASGHHAIVRLMGRAARLDPAADHRVESTADILAVLPGCDLMITDVSSVGLDFLYLHTDKPLFVTDRRNDRAALHANAPVSHCADIVDAATIGALTQTLAERLVHDESRALREAAGHYYFGGLTRGESTERFFSALDEALTTRDRLLVGLANDQPPQVADTAELQVAILAAGMGTRLDVSSPKPLTLLADGRSILGRQLDHLRQSFGDSARIVVVVGFKPDLIMSALPDVRCVYNDRFGETDTASSLLKALRTSHSGGLLWLHGDLVFDGALLDTIRPMVAADKTFVCVSSAPIGGEAVKYRVDAGGYLTALSKTLTDGLGGAVGICYVAAADKAKLIAYLERCGDQDSFERGIESAIIEEGMRVLALDISDCFVVEVDLAGDLERVNAEVIKTVTSAA